MALLKVRLLEDEPLPRGAKKKKKEEGDTGTPTMLITCNNDLHHAAYNPMADVNFTKLTKEAEGGAQKTAEEVPP